MNFHVVVKNCTRKWISFIFRIVIDDTRTSLLCWVFQIATNYSREIIFLFEWVNRLAPNHIQSTLEISSLISYFYKSINDVQPSIFDKFPPLWLFKWTLFFVTIKLSMPWLKWKFSKRTEYEWFSSVSVFRFSPSRKRGNFSDYVGKIDT